MLRNTKKKYEKWSGDDTIDGIQCSFYNSNAHML